MRALPLGFLLAAAACAVDPTSQTEDQMIEREDDGVPDASTADADAGALLGQLSGSCGIVKTLLTATTPSFETNALVFTAGETYDKTSLSDEGDRMYDMPNAGGSSVESEVMSMEVLHACEGATLLKTETEVAYVDDDAGPASITDILVSIGGTKIGVSVTRVYRPDAFGGVDDEEAKTVLVKKLEGIKRSSARVAADDRWQKQILHVFTANQAATDAVVRVLPQLDPSLRGDTVVLLTQTTGGGFIYCNPDPALGSECPP